MEKLESRQASKMGFGSVTIPNDMTTLLQHRVESADAFIHPLLHLGSSYIGDEFLFSWMPQEMNHLFGSSSILACFMAALFSGITT